MGPATLLLAAAVFAGGYLAGRTRPLREIGYRLESWGRHNSQRHLPWYRRHAADAIGLAWIGLLFATHPRRTWRRLHEHRNPPPPPRVPQLRPDWPDKETP